LISGEAVPELGYVAQEVVLGVACGAVCIILGLFILPYPSLMNDRFLSEYNKLNSQQREAVDAIDGQVMVIAGPGTGKTQVLTLRIANILLKTDTPPDAILALTFTEAGAANMRKRLVSLIGSPGYYVNISTFHGFCNRLIQEYPEYYPRIIGSESLPEVDQIGYLREVLDESEYEKLKPFGDRYHYIRDIVSAIKHLKNEGMSTADFSAWAEKESDEFKKIPDLYHERGAHKGKMKGGYQKKQKGVEKNLELARVYAGYEKILQERRRYDFDDMVLETVLALRQRKDFLLELQEKYQYLLVDEHQDTNSAQNMILELLAGFHESPNLFVVGDEKQAIFRFQGASLDNFLYFKDKYPAVRLVSLQDNYRSHQGILDSAQSLIEKNRAVLGKKLSSRTEFDVGRIKHGGFGSPGAELYFVSESIKSLTSAGMKPEEIAVIFRDNADGFRISDFLEKQGIAVNLESDRDVLHDPDICKLILLLKVVQDLGNDVYLAEALHIDFLELSLLDVYKIIYAKDYEETSLHQMLRGGPGRKKTKLAEPEKLNSFYAKLERWHKLALNKPFGEVFETVIRESGYLTSILSDKSWSRVEKLNNFFDEAKKMAGNRGDYSLKEFLAHLRILGEHGVAIRSRERGAASAVRLMTAHRAKGLEFDAVFITGLADGHWGNRRVSAKFDLPSGKYINSEELEKNEDERRLFYVSITRARKELFLSFSSRGEDGREQVPSQFLEEIEPNLKEEINVKKYESEFEADKKSIFNEKSAKEPGELNREFVRAIFEEKGLSVTALNNYLECPWRYFYQNLLRLPAVQNKYMMYGTAVHGTLQKFFDARREGRPADQEFVLEQFKFEIGRQPMLAESREDLLKKGKKELKEYYDFYHKNWNYNTVSELSIRDIELAPGVKINGKLDKLELQDKPGDVIVVDYKTGQPQSRGKIEGATEDSDGDYKRQLVFYKMLLDAYPLHKYNMLAGVIDFVQPNKQGKFKKEEFVVGAEEVASLKQEVLRVADEIINLKFWDKGCGKKDCEYCALRRLMP